MALFKILSEVVEDVNPNEVIEQIPNVDKALEWLGNNYGLIVNILTLLGLIFSVLYTFLKIKNINVGISKVSNDNKTNSKVLYENQVDSNNKVLTLIDKVEGLIEDNDKKDSQIDKLTKLIILTLQLANIPLNGKGEFLKNLNELDVNSIGDLLKGFKTSIDNVKHQEKLENDELEEQIDNLDRL